MSYVWDPATWDDLDEYLAEALQDADRRYSFEHARVRAMFRLIGRGDAWDRHKMRRAWPPHRHLLRWWR